MPRITHVDLMLISSLVLGAHGQCEDASCNAVQAPSLLQAGQNRRAAQATLRVETATGRIADLRSSLEGMALEAIKTGNVTDATKTALQSIKEEMKTVKSGINATHIEDQREVDRAKQRLDQCNTDLESRNTS